jgi:hypothetical protein
MTNDYSHHEPTEEKVMKALHATIIIASMGVMLGACAPTTISPNWGVAYQNARVNQIFNPDAGEQLDPVVGQDGKANAIAMDAYRKTFESPDAKFDKSIVSSGVKTN